MKGRSHLNHPCNWAELIEVPSFWSWSENKRSGITLWASVANQKLDIKREHPAPFPEEIITLPILQTSKEFELVLDPFMESKNFIEELHDIGIPLICAGGISNKEDYKNALEMGYAVFPVLN